MTAYLLLHVLVAFWLFTTVRVQRQISRVAHGRYSSYFLAILFFLLFLSVNYFMPGTEVSFFIVAIIESIFAKSFFEIDSMKPFFIVSIIPSVLSVLEFFSFEKALIILAVIMAVFNIFYERYFYRLSELIRRRNSIWFIFVFSVINLLIMTNSLIDNSFRAAAVSLRVGLIAVIILVAGVYWLYSFLRQREEIKILNVKNREFDKEYQRIKELYKAENIFYHDIKHNIRNVEIMLDENNIDGAREYIRRLYEPIEVLKTNKYTDILEIDATINYQRTRMESKEIEFLTDTESLFDIEIDSRDLSCLLSNLLENAMEAAEKSADKRLVKFSLKHINGMIMIKCENTYNKAKDANKILKGSSKHNKLLHGWGGISIRDMVEENNGKIDVTVTDNLVTVDITLCKAFE